MDMRKKTREKFKELKNYIPILEDLIKRLNNVDAPDSISLFTKIQELHKLLTGTTDSASMDVLLKCEAALIRLRLELEENSGLQKTEHLSPPASPPMEDKYTEQKCLIIIPTERQSTPPLTATTKSEYSLDETELYRRRSPSRYTNLKHPSLNRYSSNNWTRNEINHYDPITNQNPNKIVNNTFSDKETYSNFQNDKHELSSTIYSGNKNENVKRKTQSCTSFKAGVLKSPPLTVDDINNLLGDSDINICTKLNLSLDIQNKKIDLEKNKRREENSKLAIPNSIMPLQNSLDTYQGSLSIAPKESRHHVEYENCEYNLKSAKSNFLQNSDIRKEDNSVRLAFKYNPHPSRSLKKYPEKQLSLNDPRIVKMPGNIPGVNLSDPRLRKCQLNFSNESNQHIQIPEMVNFNDTTSYPPVQNPLMYNSIYNDQSYLCYQQLSIINPNVNLLAPQSYQFLRSSSSTSPPEFDSTNSNNLHILNNQAEMLNYLESKNEPRTYGEYLQTKLAIKPKNTEFKEFRTRSWESDNSDSFSPIYLDKVHKNVKDDDTSTKSFNFEKPKKFKKDFQKVTSKSRLNKKNWNNEDDWDDNLQQFTMNNKNNFKSQAKENLKRFSCEQSVKDLETYKETLTTDMPNIAKPDNKKEICNDEKMVIKTKQKNISDEENWDNELKTVKETKWDKKAENFKAGKIITKAELNNISDEENWDDDLEIVAKTLKSDLSKVTKCDKNDTTFKARKMSVEPKQKYISDEENWDNDLETVKKSITRLTNATKWDKKTENFKFKKIATKPKQNIISGEENWDEDIETVSKVPKTGLFKVAKCDKKNKNFKKSKMAVEQKQTNISDKSNRDNNFKHKIPTLKRSTYSKIDKNNSKSLLISTSDKPMTSLSSLKTCKKIRTIKKKSTSKASKEGFFANNLKKPVIKMNKNISDSNFLAKTSILEKVSAQCSPINSTDEWEDDVDVICEDNKSLEIQKIKKVKQCTKNYKHLNMNKIHDAVADTISSVEFNENSISKVNYFKAPKKKETAVKIIEETLKFITRPTYNQNNSVNLVELEKNNFVIDKEKISEGVKIEPLEINDEIKKNVKNNVLEILGKVISENKIQQIKSILEEKGSDNTNEKVNKIETKDEVTTDITVENVEETKINDINESITSLCHKNDNKNGPKRKKIKTELERLNDDIRDMFICQDVIKATGRRKCTVTIKNDNPVIKEVKAKTRKRKSDESSTAISERKKSKNPSIHVISDCPNKKLKKNITIQKEICNKKYAEENKTNTQHNTSSNGNDISNIIELISEENEIHIQIGLQDIKDNAELKIVKDEALCDNEMYTNCNVGVERNSNDNIKDISITNSIENGILYENSTIKPIHSAKSSKKLNSSIRKTNTKNRGEKPYKSITKNEKKLANSTSLEEFLDKTVNKQTLDDDDKIISSKLSEDYNIECIPEIIDDSLMMEDDESDYNTEDEEAVGLSSLRIYNIDEVYDESIQLTSKINVLDKEDKNKPSARIRCIIADSDVMFKNINPEMHVGSQYATKCVLCDFSGLYLSAHYVQIHPASEVLISRLAPKVLENIKLNQSNRAFWSIKKGINKQLFHYQCPFCDVLNSFTQKGWIEHFGTHTGEYTFECSECSRLFNMKLHILKHIKNSCLKAYAIRLRSMTEENKLVFAYVCDLCNYIQMSKKNVISHLIKQHDINELQFKEITLLNCEQIPHANDMTTDAQSNSSAIIYNEYEKPLTAGISSESLSEILKIDSKSNIQKEKKLSHCLNKKILNKLLRPTEVSSPDQIGDILNVQDSSNNDNQINANESFIQLNKSVNLNVQKASTSSILLSIKQNTPNLNSITNRLLQRLKETNTTNNDTEAENETQIISTTLSIANEFDNIFKEKENITTLTLKEIDSKLENQNNTVNLKSTPTANEITKNYQHNIKMVDKAKDVNSIYSEKEAAPVSDNYNNNIPDASLLTKESNENNITSNLKHFANNQTIQSLNSNEGSMLPTNMNNIVDSTDHSQDVVFNTLIIDAGHKNELCKNLKSLETDIQINLLGSNRSINKKQSENSIDVKSNILKQKSYESSNSNQHLELNIDQDDDDNDNWEDIEPPEKPLSIRKGKTSRKTKLLNINNFYKSLLKSCKKDSEINTKNTPIHSKKLEKSENAVDKFEENKSDTSQIKEIEFKKTDEIESTATIETIEILSADSDSSMDCIFVKKTSPAKLQVYDGSHVEKKHICNRIENLGFTTEAPNKIKYYCLVKTCTFVFSRFYYGLDSHLLSEHQDIKWHGFCNMCNNQIFETTNLTLQEELQHLLQIHLNINTTDDAIKDAKPILKIRRLSTDIFSTNANVIKSNLQSSYIIPNILSDSRNLKNYLDGNIYDKYEKINITPDTQNLNCSNTANVKNTDVATASNTMIVHSNNSSIEFQTSSSLKPWITSLSRKNDIYAKSMLHPICLFAKYKCMGDNCVFSTDSSLKFKHHLDEHSRANKEKLESNPFETQKDPWTECPYCSARELHANELINHITIVHLNDIYQCAYCFYRSCSDDNLLIHLSIHHRNFDVMILVCKGKERDPEEEVATITTLRSKNVKAITCSECSKVFYNLLSFVDHIRQHNTSLAFKCDICYMSLKKSNIEKHYLCKHSIGSYQCIYCICGTESTDTIRNHLATNHQSNLPYFCARVTKGFIMRGAPETIENSTMFTFHAIENIDNIIYYYCPYSEDEINYMSPLLQDFPFNLAHQEKLQTSMVKERKRTAIKLPHYTNLLKEEGQHNSMDETLSNNNNHEDADFLTLKHIETIKNYEVKLRKVLKDNEDEKQDIHLIHKKKSNSWWQLVEQTARKVVVGTGLENEELYRCLVPDCNVKVQNLFNFNVHMMQHVKSGHKVNWNCKHCEKTFQTLTTLKCHLKLHISHKYFCFFCEYTGPTAKKTCLHILNVHSEIVTSEGYPLIPGHTEPGRDFFVLYPSTVQDTSSYLISKHLMKLWESKKVIKKIIFHPEESHQLPPNSTYSIDLHCGVCSYKSKIQKNFRRHLELHKRKVTVAPVDPVNPVPCLNSKEKHFDKMTNLACSSNTNKINDNQLFNTKLPIYVPMCQRFKCCFKNSCNFTGKNEEKLSEHIVNAHTNINSFTCLYCEFNKTNKIQIDDIIQHLKFHGENLYQCKSCFFIHYDQNIVTNHLKDKHRRKSVLMICYSRTEDETSTSYATVTSKGKIEISKETLEKNTDSFDIIRKKTQISSLKWECALCKNKTQTRYQMIAHVSNIHNMRMQFQCNNCPYGDLTIAGVSDHAKRKHPSKISEVRCIFYKISTTALKNDTTPLWCRDPNRVKNIRGILVDEESDTVHDVELQKKTTSTTVNIPFEKNTAPNIERKDGIKWSCYFCDYKCLFFSELIFHWKTFHQKPQKLGNDVNNLGNPLLFLVIPEYKCLHCSIIGSYQDIVNHHKKHHLYKPLALKSVTNDKKCGLCEFTFESNPKALVEHYKKEHQTKDSLLTEDYINYVSALYKTQSLTVCLKCHNIFSNMQTYIEHHQAIHGNIKRLFGKARNEKKLFYGCSDCHFIYLTEKSLMEHLFEHLFFKCTVCEKYFKGVRLSRSHIKNEHKQNIDTINNIDLKIRILDKIKMTKIIFSNGLVLVNDQIKNTSFSNINNLTSIAHKILYNDEKNLQPPENRNLNERTNKNILPQNQQKKIEEITNKQKAERNNHDPSKVYINTNLSGAAVNLEVEEYAKFVNIKPHISVKRLKNI